MSRYFLTFPQSDFDQLSQMNSTESSVVFASIARQDDATNLIVRRIGHLPAQRGTSLDWDSATDKNQAFLVAKRAGSRFSPELPYELRNRDDGPIFGSLGFKSEGIEAWVTEDRKSVPIDRIKVIGRKVVKMYPVNSSFSDSSDVPKAEKYHRQMLAFGEMAQKLFRKTTVAVVGIGGGGSVVLQQLLHMGVGRIIAMDKDVVEMTNLGRLVGAREEDARKSTPKVKVVERMASEINPDTELITVQDWCYNSPAALRLREADVIFSCTDNHYSRFLMNMISIQYHIPVIDSGIRIGYDRPGDMTWVAGRITTVTPRTPCMFCLGLIWIDEVRKEIHAIREGGPCCDNPAANATSWLSATSSLAVAEFIDLLTGVGYLKEPGTVTTYWPLSNTFVNMRVVPKGRCSFCDELRGAGDSSPLPSIQNDRLDEIVANASTPEREVRPAIYLPNDLVQYVGGRLPELKVLTERERTPLVQVAIT